MIATVKVVFRGAHKLMMTLSFGIHIKEILDQYLLKRAHGSVLLNNGIPRMIPAE